MIDDIEKYFDVQEQDHSIMAKWLKGHLFIEHFLRLNILHQQPQLTDFISELSFYKIVKLAEGLGCINSKQAITILEINKVRNRFAHNYEYTINTEEFYNIVIKARDCFSDFTDGLDQVLGEFNDKITLENCDDWICTEFFLQILYDLDNNID